MFTSLLLQASGAAGSATGGMADFVTDLSNTIGIDLFDEDIDNVVFQTNEFLCNSDFIGSQGPFWWLLVVAVTNPPKHSFNRCKPATCKFLSRDTKSARDKNETKPRKKKSRTLRPKYPLWNTSVSFAKVQICPLKNEGKSLFLSFTTHFPTIVPQMWLLQAILTSNSMTCEYRVLNFVLHFVGHFQKRELAIEPKICHPYCPILGLVNV